MKIRGKMFLILLAAIVPVILLFFLFTSWALLGQSARMEAQMMRAHILRAMNALANELNALGQTTFDWAAWDDTYGFMQTRNQEYLDANLVDSSFEVLNLNLIAWIGTNGEVMASGAYDLAQKLRTPVPEAWSVLWSGGAPLLAPPGSQKPVKGWLHLDGRVFLAASYPILTSEQAGPSQGRLIMGRFVDRALIDRMAGIVDLPLQLLGFDSPTLPKNIAAVKSELLRVSRPTLDKRTQVLVRQLSKTRVAGYGLVMDLQGKPLLIVALELPRDVSVAARVTLARGMAFIAGLGILFLLLMSWLAERYMVQPLMQLACSVDRIREDRSLSLRLTATGNDEIAVLQRHLNGMLDALQQSREELGRLSAHLQNIREHEWERLGRKLHDDLGQLLMKLKIDAAYLATKLAEQGDGLAAHAKTLPEQIDDIAEALRRVAMELRPVVLDSLPSADAIEWLVQQFRHSTGLPIDLQVEPPELNLEKDLTTTVFRIVQEALTNVARHAEATQASVILRVDGPRLHLQVMDNGKGIVPERLNSPDSFGLIQLRERTAQAGGAAAIEHAPGGGTVVRVVLPYLPRGSATTAGQGSGARA